MLAAIALLASLGLDTFAVAVGLGVSGLPRARWIRVGVTLACFEGIMPVLGLLAGRHAAGFLGVLAAYVAGGLLVVLGGLEIRDAVGELREEHVRRATPVETEVLSNQASAAGRPDATRGFRQWRATLVTGMSVSLDELAVGFSLGVLHVALGPALAFIAVQAFGLTLLGLFVGNRVGARLGERAELAAGILLVLLGIALLAGEATGFHFL